MVTLFNLLMMGIWSPLMQSYKELTGTSWTYVYFFSFYVIAVPWLLNLIVVFVLEAFQAEMNLEASTRIVDGEDKEERRGQRRPVGAKTRSPNWMIFTVACLGLNEHSASIHKFVHFPGCFMQYCLQKSNFGPGGG
ncbi:two pore calcium channel protein 1B-like [Nicotiana tabacum]|uniref:Two pore calcium channel protein 1B-like n=3 Tax=Nicotiana TaxID=4085 RepID=A0A1S4DRY9_TOBAC|nr:PREDICTED: two pore calcium channel protein 1B-like [Nicotiana sylvestris]XP_016516190.1 PREDICTED: two pore calcium channel protein 1B-like [Nicotiana tabacum]